MGFLDYLLRCLCPCFAHPRRQQDEADSSANVGGFIYGYHRPASHPGRLHESNQAPESNKWRTVKPSPTPKPVSHAYLTLRNLLLHWRGVSSL